MNRIHVTRVTFEQPTHRLKTDGCMYSNSTKEFRMKAWMLFTATSLFFAAASANATTLNTELHLSQDINERFTKQQVRKIYLGKTKHLDDGTRLKLTCMQKGEMHRDFLKQWVGMTPSQFKIHWQKRVFTGKGKMPYRFKKNSDQQDFVNNTHGAIGYKGSSKVKKVNNGPSYFDPKTARYIKVKRS
jgi:hypothetical protein